MIIRFGLSNQFITNVTKFTTFVRSWAMRHLRVQLQLNPIFSMTIAVIQRFAVNQLSNRNALRSSEIEFYKLWKRLYIQQGNNIDSSLFACIIIRQKTKTKHGISEFLMRILKCGRNDFLPSSFPAAVELKECQ